MKSKKVKKTPNIKKNRAIFLDRDGVINEYIDHLSREKDFLLYTYTAEAIKKINDSDFLAVVITNQPMIAKGFMSHDELKKIHKKMEKELLINNAKIDAIYYCPHHPQKGFEGEVSDLKILCICRKPNIALIQNAVQDFNIDLNKSFFIGDASVDAKTAENAGITFVGVETGIAMKDNKYPIKYNIRICATLLEAVENILSK